MLLRMLVAIGSNLPWVDLFHSLGLLATMQLGSSWRQTSRPDFYMQLAEGLNDCNLQVCLGGSCEQFYLGRHAHMKTAVFSISS